MSELINSKIVGVSNLNKDSTSRQEIIRELIYNGDSLMLEREPHNEYAPNAIAVYFDSPNLDEHLQVGYLHNSLADRLAPLMDTGRVITAEVSEVTGLDQATRGVNIQLNILTQEEALERKKWIAALAKGYSKQSAQIGLSKFSKSKKNVWITIILWFLLGIFGAHRWYAGRGSWFFTLTLGYLLIGWLFDFFQILLGEFKDGEGRRVWVL